jgi:hypothetical protein
MSKIVSVVFAAVLTVVAAGFWLKSSVSETEARARSEPVKGLSLYDHHLMPGLKLLPVQQVDDKSFVFAENE